MLNADLMNSPSDLATLVNRVRAGSDMLVTQAGEAGRDLLDDAALVLSGECRTVRVSAREPGLSLSGLMAQIAGPNDPAAQDDAVLELGYQILSLPDAPGQRIVWLIDGAEKLQRPALRYVQHMVRSAGALILVMAGSPAFAALLDGDDFSGLRDRLLPAPQPRVPGPLRAERSLIPVPAASTMLETRRVGPFLVLAGVGIAASVALGVWIGRSKWDATPATVAASALAPAHLALSGGAHPAAPPVPAASPVAVAAAPAPLLAPSSAAAVDLAPRNPVQAAVEPRHDRGHVTDETARARRPRHLEGRAREVATGPRRVQSAGLAENPPPAYRGAWAQQPPDWAPAARPAQNWQPRADQGYASGYEPQNSYIGTYSTDRFGYRTFRYDP